MRSRDENCDIQEWIDEVPFKSEFSGDDDDEDTDYEDDEDHGDDEDQDEEWGENDEDDDKYGALIK